MKKINLLFGVILILSFSVLTPFEKGQGPQVHHLKCIGGTGEECIFNMIKLSDGKYLSCGYTDSHDGDFNINRDGHDLDAFLMKTEANGDTIWVQTYGGSKDDVFYNIIETTNQEIIAIGTSGSNDDPVKKHHGAPGTDDVWLVKTDRNGNLIDNRCYGGRGSESTFDLGMTEGLIIDKNGNILFAGETNSTDGDVHGNHGDYDCWIVKVKAATFDTIQTKTIGGAHYDAAVNIHEINRSIFLTGITALKSYSNPASDIESVSDGFAAKLDPLTLDTIWYNTYGGSGSEFCNASVVSPDGNLILTGHAASSDGDCVGNIGFNTWTWKIDTSNGKIIWKNFTGQPGETSAAFNILTTHDKGVVVIGGIFHPQNLFLPDAYAVKIKANGDTAWTKRFGGSDLDQLLGGVEKNDFNLLLGGWTSSTDRGVTGLYVGGSPASNKYHRYPAGKRNGPAPDAWLVELSPN